MMGKAKAGIRIKYAGLITGEPSQALIHFRKFQPFRIKGVFMLIANQRLI